MISSMTAFGRAQREASGIAVTAEVRALNGRGLDIVLRLPKNCLEFEDPLRKQIAQVFRRGRIEAFVQIETTSIEQKAPAISPALARHYWQQLQDLHRSLPGSEPPRLEHLLQIPYLFESREIVADREVLGQLLTQTVAEALEQVRRMRLLEGEALLQDALARLAGLREDLSRIEGRKDVVLEEYRKRLRDRVQELLEDRQLDEGRLLQEVACVADRTDINEELVRLQSHLDQFESLLTDAQAADGRRLDFLAQELHREVNTIGCKTADLESLQAVVRMKTEIGKLKEQVQNVE